MADQTNHKWEGSLHTGTSWGSACLVLPLPPHPTSSSKTALLPRVSADPVEFALALGLLVLMGVTLRGRRKGWDPLQLEALSWPSLSFPSPFSDHPLLLCPFLLSILTLLPLTLSLFLPSPSASPLLPLLSSFLNPSSSIPILYNHCHIPRQKGQSPERKQTGAWGPGRQAHLGLGPGRQAHLGLGPASQTSRVTLGKLILLLGSTLLPLKSRAANGNGTDASNDRHTCKWEHLSFFSLPAPPSPPSCQSFSLTTILY